MTTNTTEPTRPPTRPNPELPAKHTFSVTELAEMLGVNHKTIREQIAGGKIRVTRLGRVIRIPRS